MANRLKTVQFTTKGLGTLPNGTLTNLPQTDIYLPETGTKTIKKAWVEVSMDDQVGDVAGSITTKTVNLRLAAAGYATTTNANTMINTGESISLLVTRDFTSHFETNWTGTSMTCDIQLEFIQTGGGSPSGFVNVNAIIYITYEYDDMSNIQIKTVLIPLNAPSTSLASTKTSYDTLPALDTYLPESGKVYRDTFVVFSANIGVALNQPDFAVNFEMSTQGPAQTQGYAQSFSTDRFVRYIWGQPVHTTNVTHTFNMWSTQANTMDCPMAYYVVTYQFDANLTSNIMNSLQIPMKINSPMGISATDFQRATLDFWVQETTPVRQRLAFYMHFQHRTNPAGLHARIGTGSFTAYAISGVTVIAGNHCFMIRNDTPDDVPFNRGKNTLQMDIYNTSTTEFGGVLGGFWLLNYTSVATSGANRTVLWPMSTQGTGPGARRYVLNATSPTIPESEYFISTIGYDTAFMQGTTSWGYSLKTERLSGSEGGLIFEEVHISPAEQDNELGVFHMWSSTTDLFTRWSGSIDTTKMDIESPRRYIFTTFQNSNNLWLNHMVMMFTYHTITHRVAGDITGSDGANVDIYLHRNISGDRVMQGSRTGNGTYAFEWFDNTEAVEIIARETDLLKGVSLVQTASVLPVFDINLSTGSITTTSGEFFF